jgi:hypothetical protein
MKIIISSSQLSLLKENVTHTYIKRRTKIADEYFNSLNPKDICDYWHPDEVEDYIHDVITEMIRYIIWDYPDAFNNTNLNGAKNYDKVLDLLTRLGFPEKIKNFFQDTMSKCERIAMMDTFN